MLRRPLPETYVRDEKTNTIVSTFFATIGSPGGHGENGTHGNDADDTFFQTTNPVMTEEEMAKDDCSSEDSVPKDWETSSSVIPAPLAPIKTDRTKYVQIRSDAYQRGLYFFLTEEFASHLFQQPCHYCGCLPDSLASKRMGIDRVDSGQGYFKRNVVPCCSVCNYMKNTMTTRLFLHQCKLIVKHMAGESPYEQQ